MVKEDDGFHRSYEIVSLQLLDPNLYFEVKP